jgi:hypothetical protein
MLFVRHCAESSTRTRLRRLVPGCPQFGPRTWLSGWCKIRISAQLSPCFSATGLYFRRLWFGLPFVVLWSGGRFSLLCMDTVSVPAAGMSSSLSSDSVCHLVFRRGVFLLIFSLPDSWIVRHLKLVNVNHLFFSLLALDSVIERSAPPGKAVTARPNDSEFPRQLGFSRGVKHILCHPL